MIGNLAAGFSRKISEVIIFRGTSSIHYVNLHTHTLALGIAGAGGGGIVSMAQIIMSDVVSQIGRAHV